MNKSTNFYVNFFLATLVLIFSCSKNHYSREDKDKLPRIETGIVEVIPAAEGSKLDHYIIRIPDGKDVRTGEPRTREAIATANTKMRMAIIKNGLSGLVAGDIITVIPRIEREARVMGEYEIIGAFFPHGEIKDAY